MISYGLKEFLRVYGLGQDCVATSLISFVTVSPKVWIFSAIIGSLMCFLLLLIGSINSTLKAFKKFIAGSTKLPSLFTAVASFFAQNGAIAHNFEN